MQLRPTLQDDPKCTICGGAAPPPPVGAPKDGLHDRRPLNRPRAADHGSRRRHLVVKSGRIVLIVVGSAVVAGAALGGIGAAVLGGPHSLQPKHPPVSLVNGQVPLDLPHRPAHWMLSRQHYCEMAGVGRATQSLLPHVLPASRPGTRRSCRTTRPWRCTPTRRPWRLPCKPGPIICRTTTWSETCRDPCRQLHEAG